MKNLFLVLVLLTPAARAAGDAGDAPPRIAEPDRSKPVPAGPARPFGVPALRRGRIAVDGAKDGVALTATELKSLPIVAVKIVIPAAGAMAAAGLGMDAEALSQMTSALLQENTQVRDGDAFSRALERLGASFSVSVAADAAVVSVFAMKDSIDEALALASEALLRPKFRDSDLGRVQMQTIASLKQETASPEGAATRRLSARVFGDHPYGASATPESVAAVQGAGAVEAYHALAYRPEGASIHAVGDISLEELKSMAERHFARWPIPSLSAAVAAQRAISQVPTPDVRAAAEAPGTIDLIDMPGSPQSVILVGQTALPRGHADYYPLKVLNLILGGPDGRINEILRERKKWAYGAHSSLAAERDGGILELEAPVQTDKTSEALAIMLAEMKRLQDEDVGAAELEKVKAIVVGSSLRSLQTVQSIAGARADAEIYGLGDDSIAQNRERLLAVTAADVRRVAKLYLRPEFAAVVVSGDAAKVKDGLEKLAPVRVIGAAKLIESA